jgi:hypothetical protein
MIANRFKHSLFPKPSGTLNNNREKDEGSKNIRRKLKVSKSFNENQQHHQHHSHHRDNRHNHQNASLFQSAKPFDSSKIPLEGIELLLDREKVPENLGKKMDPNRVDPFTQKTEKEKTIEPKDISTSGRPPRENETEDISKELDEIISDVESTVDSENNHRDRENRNRKHHRPKLRRKKDRLKRSSSEGRLPKHHATETEQGHGKHSNHYSVNSEAKDEGSGEEEYSDSGSLSSSTASTRSVTQSEESGSESDSGESVEKDEEERRWRSPAHMTNEEILQEKERLLYEYGRLADNGYKSGLAPNMKTPLESLRAEVFRLKKLRNVQKSIRFQRKMLVTFASATEYCNRRFNPYKFSLDGWSGDVLDNIGDYDEIFEELYEKYSESVQMAPEFRLAAMVGGSGLMYHLSQSLFKNSTPDMQDVLSRNPHIMEQIQNAAMGQMAQQHGGNFFFDMMRNGSQMRASASPPAPPTASFQRRANRGPVASNMSSSVGASVKEVPSGQGIMRGPDGVDDILEQLNGMEASQATLVSDIEDDDNGGIVKEVNTKTRRARGGKKRSSGEDVIDISF